MNSIGSKKSSPNWIATRTGTWTPLNCSAHRSKARKMAEDRVTEIVAQKVTVLPKDDDRRDRRAMVGVVPKGIDRAMVNVVPKGIGRETVNVAPIRDRKVVHLAETRKRSRATSRSPEVDRRRRFGLRLNSDTARRSATIAGPSCLRFGRRYALAERD